ncbi:MAG TPA: vitamin K epoxide reductase family protein [Pyrinomonadaceae bacterium]|nr:vitamin K epoxide reductase family protein [Pyrinomonadaceae bacterium]
MRSPQTAAHSSPTAIPWTYLSAALLALIGLGDAVYLTIQHITGASLRCTVISGCSEVLSSPYAQVGPMPLAAIGAAAYFVVFSFAILAAFSYGFAIPLLRIVVALMFLTTLWLLYLQAFVIKHFCQYCLLSAAVTIAVVAILFLPALWRRRR